MKQTKTFSVIEFLGPHGKLSPDDPKALRKLILSYDRADRLNQRHVIRGALLMREPDVQNDDWIRLGQVWCELVNHDLQQTFEPGIALARENLALAQTLTTTLSGAYKQDPDRFEAYVVSRFFDGIGRLSYRMGRYIDAVNFFDRAQTLANEHEVWWVWPDVSSNLRRAQLEVARQLGQKRSDAPNPWTQQLDLITQCTQDLKRILATHRRHYPDTRPLPTSENIDTTACLELQEPREAELARGVCNLLHNCSVAYDGIRGMIKTPNAQKSSASPLLKELRELHDGAHGALRTLEDAHTLCTDMSRSYNTAAAYYAEQLDDGYRKAQTLQHKVRLVEKSSQRELFERMLNEPAWPLGQLIAEQQLLKLELDKSKTDPSIREAVLHKYQNYFAKEAFQKVPMGALAVHAWTVSHLQAGVRAFDKPTETSLASWHDHKERGSALADEQLERSIKQIRYTNNHVQHKKLLDSHVRPFFQRKAGEAIQRALESQGKLQQEHLRVALQCVEEICAREYADRFITRQLESGKYDPERELPHAHLVEKATIAKSERPPGWRVLNENRYAEFPAPHNRGETATRSIARTSSQEVPRDLIWRLQQQLASYRDTVVIRFVVYQKPGDDKTKHLGAMIIGAAKIDLVLLEKDQDGKGMAHADFARDLGRFREIPTSFINQPSENPYLQYGNALYEQVLKHVPPRTERLVVIPIDELAQIPFHALAWKSGKGTRTRWELWSARYATLNALSVLMLVQRNRLALDDIWLAEDDDLCACIVQDRADDKEVPAITGAELLDVAWPTEHFWVVGDLTKALSSQNRTLHPHRQIAQHSSLDALEELVRPEPELLLISAHGDVTAQTLADAPKNGLVLHLDSQNPDKLTPIVDLASCAIPRNKLTILASCMGASHIMEEGRISNALLTLTSMGAGLMMMGSTPLHGGHTEEFCRRLLQKLNEECRSDLAASSGPPARLSRIAKEIYGKMLEEERENNATASMVPHEVAVMGLFV